MSDTKTTRPHPLADIGNRRFGRRSSLEGAFTNSVFIKSIGKAYCRKPVRLVSVGRKKAEVVKATFREDITGFVQS